MTGHPPRIRSMTTADRAVVREFALVNGMFAPDEMAGFDEMLAGFLDHTLPDHHWVVAASAGGSSPTSWSGCGRPATAPPGCS
jgi:hypothetical protein